MATSLVREAENTVMAEAMGLAKTFINADRERWINIVLLTCPVLGLIWAVYECCRVMRVRLDGHKHASLSRHANNLEAPLVVGEDIESASGVQLTSTQLKNMMKVSDLIRSGSSTFLWAEFKWMLVYITGFSFVIGPVVNYPTMWAFVVGALSSMLCGWIGMRVATYANIRTAHEAHLSLKRAFEVAVSAGSVMGLCLVSLAVTNLSLLIFLYRRPSMYGNHDYRELFEAIAGYGLGGSSIALFGRVGGGIYTKAADVGADLSGKNEYGMSEDDPRNPACIADNVGDNVGDVAGMGSDLFGSLAESTCAALVIAGTSTGLHGLATGNDWGALMFPVLLSSCSILCGIVTLIVVRRLFPVNELRQIELSLKNILVVSTVTETMLVPLLAWWLLPEGTFNIAGGIETNRLFVSVTVWFGLWAGLIIGFVTEYYTSHSYRPVREIAETQKISASTGIIYGLALGYSSTIVPVCCLAATICVAHRLAGMYGIALSALGMLGTLTMSLTIDAYGPISDNAGGIAEMAELGPEARMRTDALDAAGNTTAAIGKGFAIGSAALVSLALTGAYTVRANILLPDLLDHWVLLGLLLGAMLPYAFSAMTMKAVGTAAHDMVLECLRQFPKIVNEGAEPDYKRCIRISTEAALRQMVLPGAMVITAPLLCGIAFGKNCTAGLLIGALVSGIQMAISAANSGGAWDNAKKYIEAGNFGDAHQKGSDTHKNAVIGDTVGDPMKDTSGPSLNILIKLSAIISLVFGSVLAERFSNASGGPVWL